jgi:hypothetical protein
VFSILVVMSRGQRKTAAKADEKSVPKAAQKAATKGSDTPPQQQQ